MEQNYKLTATTLKNGKTLYQVIDNHGNIMSKRTSTRNYVACTINGEFYFGRLDLIGKGDHGQRVSSIQDCKVNTPEKYNKIVNDRIKEIKACNRMHLSTYRQFSTPEQLNAPIQEWQHEHLVKFFGKEVADSVKTQWEYQVANTNDERDIKEFKQRIGNFWEWRKRRMDWVAEVEPKMVIAYLEN